MVPNATRCQFAHLAYVNVCLFERWAGGPWFSRREGTCQAIDSQKAGLCFEQLCVIFARLQLKWIAPEVRSQHSWGGAGGSVAARFMSVWESPGPTPRLNWCCVFASRSKGLTLLSWAQPQPCSPWSHSPHAAKHHGQRILKLLWSLQLSNQWLYFPRTFQVLVTLLIRKRGKLKNGIYDAELDLDLIFFSLPPAQQRSNPLSCSFSRQWDY